MDFDLKDLSWQSINFQNLEFLAFALFIILFLLFEYFPGRNYFYSLESLKKFIDRHLIPHLIQGHESKTRAWLRIVYVSIIWVLLCIALANPRWDYEEIKGYRPNVNIVFLLDVSKSMDTRDEKPSRLERAKQEIIDILRKLDATNAGLIAFAHQSYTISPITEDKNAILYLLNSVDTSLVGVQGSNIAAALRSADLLLRPEKNGINYIIVLSDGGFENRADLPDLRKSVKNGTIITFGIGNEQGAPIPDSNGRFIEENGKTVVSKLEKENLIMLSGLDNYIQLSFMGDDTDKIIKIVTKKLGVLKAEFKQTKIWHDRFYIPLIIAMLMLLPFFRKGIIFPVIIFFFSNSAFAQTAIPPQDPQKIIEETGMVDKEKKVDDFYKNLKKTMFHNNDQQAKHEYDNQNFSAAENKFKSNYNRGNAAFRAKNYELAEKYYSKDAGHDPDSEYNKGNAQLLQMKADDAIKTYESVLKKNPDHKDAKFNLELAKKLKQQQQQQGQGQSNNHKENKKHNKKNNKQNQQDNKGNQAQNQPRDNDQDNGQQEQPQQNENESEKKSQETDGKTGKKELDMQAKSILNKLSNDPGRLMKNRFRLEEIRKQQDDKNKTDSQVIRPW